jgi:hypothetical protein
MVVGKRRLSTDGLNRAAAKKQFLSVTNPLMSVYSEANGAPNHALQRTLSLGLLDVPTNICLISHSSFSTSQR